MSATTAKPFVPNEAIRKLPLMASFWKHNARLQEAKTRPFRSMIKGRDTGTEAVQLLQAALVRLDGTINFLGGDSVVSGPFFIPASEFDPGDASRCAFGLHTEKAVKLFQGQSRIEVDGFAGIMTLRVMDMLLSSLEDE